MPLKNKIFFLTLIFSLSLAAISYAQQDVRSQWQVNTGNINVRFDSTVTSQVICTMDKGEIAEVVSQSYEWRKIRLPKQASAFINKKFLSLLDEKTAKVSADNVNIRLSPNDSSAILGKAKENEVVSILGKTGDWYRIEPTGNSFGWVHSRFLKQADKKAGEEAARPKANLPAQEEITVQGIVKAKTIKRVATHKLITEDNDVFLLKGNKESLDALNGRKAKICGKRIDLPNQEYPLIEITKMEALD